MIRLKIFLIFIVFICVGCVQSNVGFDDINVSDGIEIEEDEYTISEDTKENNEEKEEDSEENEKEEKEEKDSDVKSSSSDSSENPSSSSNDASETNGGTTSSSSSSSSNESTNQNQTTYEENTYISSGTTSGRSYKIEQTVYKTISSSTTYKIISKDTISGVSTTNSYVGANTSAVESSYRSTAINATISAIDDYYVKEDAAASASSGLAATLAAQKETIIATNIYLCNVDRNAQGLSSLTRSTTLDAVASVRAQEIMTLFSHTRPSGTLSALLEAYGYYWQAQGENILYTSQSSTDYGTLSFSLWKNSATHYANIMSPAFKEIGIGVATDGSKVYMVQIFGTKAY